MTPLRLAAFLLFLAFAGANERTHKYVDKEEVALWVNKVGPFRNPQETYNFYKLPFCKPDTRIKKRQGLGEDLQGYELQRSLVNVHFKEDVPQQEICKKTLTADEVPKFRHAIENQYWYQLFLDDLPIWGMVGEQVGEPDSTQTQAYIYTHQKFVITYNDERIIEVNLTSERPQPLEVAAQISFTYSVRWHRTGIAYEDRFEKYLDYSFFEHQIHWFSIFNSFMMVIFLTGLVAMILMRTLRKDYARYATRDEEDFDEDRDVGDESGWKQVHGDVFRAPPMLDLFSALVGTGHQLVILVLCLIIFSILGTFYIRRGTIITCFIISYAFTSLVAGYGGGGYYARNGGKNWIKTMLITAGLFPGLCFLIGFLLNFIAIGYGSSAAIPFVTMVYVLLIWVFISFPLTLLGTVIGKNWSGVPDNPCRINPVPRHIPEKKWFLHPAVNVCLGGILPFGSIFIEMYFVFTSFWHYKYYYVYGFMLLVYIILIIVSVCVTIVGVYFLLTSEDYRWHWTSFLSSASTAAYVYIYSIYYFFAKTKMSGFFQTAFYFGYMLMFCIGLAIFCGAVGFIGTSVFVRAIFKNVKIE